MPIPEGSPRAPEQGPFSLRLEPALVPFHARLPRGRHGLPRDFIERNHRNRVLSGAIDSVAERGYLATTIADVARHAAVSRGTFYRHFADKQDCFLTAHELVAEWFEHGLREATADVERWPQQVATAVVAGLAMLGKDPRLPRFGAVEIFLAGPVAVARHEALLERLAVPLRAGRTQRPGGTKLTPHLERTLLAGMVGLIASYASTGRAERLPELGPGLTEILLLPYLGLRWAREVSHLVLEGR